MKSKATNNSFFHLCAFHEFLSHMHDSTLKALLQEKKTLTKYLDNEAKVFMKPNFYVYDTN